MKFVVDESTGRSVADFLDEKGFDTVYVGEEMRSAEDDEVMDFASKENRIVVTNDKDFGRKTVKEGRSTEGVLLLRLKIETPGNKIESVRNILENHREKLEGNLVVAKEDQVKVRKTPE